MHIAVTGAGGTLGRAVVARALADGEKVTALDRTRPDVGDAVVAREVDLTDHRATTDALTGVDALIHLAALISPRAAPEPEVHDNNVLSSYHALLAAQRNGVHRVCMASSVNAIGGIYSEHTHFEYFPLDVAHPTYAADGYGLSKWIAEQQAAAFARREPNLSVDSLRLHALRAQAPTPRASTDGGQAARDLWAWTPLTMAVDACLAVVRRSRPGARVYYVVAPQTWNTIPSRELAARHYPQAVLRDDFGGRDAFYDSAPIGELLARS